MFIFRKCRRRTFCMYTLSSLLFFCAWTFMTMLLLVAQEQYQEQQLLQMTTEDSYLGRGVQIVVGHYNGKLPDGNKKNLTAEQLNHQGYAPEAGVGEMGRAVKLSAQEELVINDLFAVNQFNLVVSDRIALNRSLPDMRKERCRTKEYDDASLPTTSVVIVYHNEAWSTLLRTVTSVINRSPGHLLTEVILVDDYSNRTFLGTPLDEYVAKLSKPVKIVRADRRVGLIRARLMGAKEAKGDVLTFLDSHCECTEGWLQPLLHRIKEDRKNVVCPVIDVINDRTFAYNKGIEMFRGAFNWNLQFRWYGVPPSLVKERRDDGSLPITSPAMAGGLFSIDREYFEELGSYDPHMDIWGGENIEISLRIWMCGGRVEILPCSHVGHIFRKASPHDFPDNGTSKILNANLVRVAEVWMDEWKHLFYKTAPAAEKMARTMDVSDRVELRRRLRCHDFKWYLDNVWFDHFMPLKDEFFGRIESAALGQCLAMTQVANPLSANNGRGRQVTVEDCADNFWRPQIEHASTNHCFSSTPKEPGRPKHTLGLKQCTLGFDMWQLWIYTPTGQIKSDEHQCLSATQIGQQWFTQLKECGSYPNEFWDYDKKYETLTHRMSGLCLDKPSNSNGNKEQVHMPSLNKCAIFGKNRHQSWTMHKVAWRPEYTTL